MANVIGHATCPECSETNPVWSDGRKYYIKCSSCHTFTHYQSKPAKERLLTKLQPLEEEPDKPESLPARASETPSTPPLDAVNGGFFDDYGNYY